MKYLILLCIVGLCPTILQGQFSDDFSDGNFTNNPVWNGDTTKFIVSNKNKLQLYDTNFSGEASLYTSTQISYAAEWQFEIEFEFNPSSSNLARVYLLADSNDLAYSQNAIYVEIGNTDDAVSLYKISNGEKSLLIDGKEKRLNTSDVHCQIKVTRDSVGNWQLFSDTLAEGNLFFEGEFADKNNYLGEYAGIWCKYTSTRSNKMYFDNFIFTGKRYFDSIPPEINSLQVISTNEISLLFSEACKPEFIQDVQNYKMQLGQYVLYPIKISIIGDSALLTFNQNFSSHTSYNFSISNIEDLFGNPMHPFSSNLQINYPQLFDVVFTEIMADYSPTINLPEAEYIEIYNRDNDTLWLENCQLLINKDSFSLPNLYLNPNRYYLISSEDNKAFFTSYENMIFLDISKDALLNDGASLQIINPNKELIAFLNYSKDWYINESKSAGGWSLECIHPDYLCEKNAWRGSVNSSGGTPGYVNSVFSTSYSNTIPYITSVGYTNDSLFKVTFSEEMHPLKNSINLNYRSSENASLYFKSPVHDVAHLAFDHSIDENILEIMLPEAITDCELSKPILIKPLLIGKPQHPMAGGLLLNEILYDAGNSDIDFVELYNASTQCIDLQNIFISTATNNKYAEDATPLFSQSFLLFPGELIALCKNTFKLAEEYNCPDDAYIVACPNLPNLSNDGGKISLLSPDFTIIDIAEFNDQMHHPNLDLTTGVSLEKILLESNSNEKSNWTSAGANVLYATPGYINSQAIEEEFESAKTFTLPDDIFSPDNDGYEDLLSIQYTFPKEEYLTSIHIFDANGQLVKTLKNNELIGISGKIIWDGTNKNRDIVKNGIYIIIIEYYHSNEKIMHEKLSCVVAKKY